MIYYSALTTFNLFNLLLQSKFVLKLGQAENVSTTMEILKIIFVVVQCDSKQQFF